MDNIYLVLSTENKDGDIGFTVSFRPRDVITHVGRMAQETDRIIYFSPELWNKILLMAEKQQFDIEVPYG